MALSTRHRRADPDRSSEAGPPAALIGDDGEERADLWFSDQPQGGPRGSLEGQGGRSAAAREAEAWISAETTLAGPLAGAAAALARLDERLAAMAPGHRTGALGHLARLEIADLVWAEGHRLRPERLALFDLDRSGRTGEDAALVGRAGWALRRALAVPRSLGTPEDVARTLAHRLSGAGAMEGRSGLEPGLLEALPELAGDRAEGWLAVLPPVGACHPLTRAGAGFAAWRRGRPEHLLEPAILAAALALPRAPGPVPGGLGLTFLPLALGRPVAGLGQGARIEARLAGWLGAVAGAAAAGRRRLLDLEDWRVRAAEKTAGMRGRGGLRSRRSLPRAAGALRPCRGGGARHDRGADP
ncbi:MAG: hypothetical protein AAFV49_05695 [Pseudomonadota bacterium]